jgi:hypothetical protein
MGAADDGGSTAVAPSERRSFAAVLANRRDRRRLAPIETIGTPRTEREVETVGREQNTD